MSVRVLCAVQVANGSFDLAARAIVLQAFLYHLAIQGAARALLRSFTVQGRCIGPETRALLAAILWCHGTQRIMSREIFRTCWRAASSEAFALYVIAAGFGRAPKTFLSVRMRVRAVALCASFEPACRANSA
jgi:hypothetical protein